MNLTSAMVEPDVDGFDLAGLTQAPLEVVKPPRVAERPVQFECAVTDMVRLRDRRREAVDSWLTIGAIIGIHVRQVLLKDGIFDTFGADIILRARGPSAYLHVTGEHRFDIHRPRE